jgi:RNA ligase (TIGR02306 family)
MKQIIYRDIEFKTEGGNITKMENQNSVCFVAKVKEIKPIEGADNIELAFIQGWGSIVQKGKHKEGDLVVVATVDAVIPQDLSDAINVTNYLRKGQRVRTVKLKGVYSECLIIPVAENGLYEGKDMMERLKISKYEPPAVQVQLASGKKIRYHQNPNFLVYYKFPNIKNVSGMFTENDLVQITRKLHGTNARYGIVKKNKLSLWDKVKKFFRVADEWIDYEYVYGSHNVEKGSDSQGFYSTDVWKTVADQNHYKAILWDIAKSWGKEKVGSGIVMYGEIYGAGIQKGYDYGLKDIQFAAFDFMLDGKYEDAWWVEHTCKVYSIPHVPILFDGWWSQEVQDKFTFNNNIEGTKVPHEGIVVKHVSGDRHKIAKVINPQYLIYSEKHDIGDSH